MNLIELETILRDQKTELDLLREDNLISRPEENLIDLRSRQAQVVIGVRRSGKSTLCLSLIHIYSLHTEFSSNSPSLNMFRMWRVMLFRVVWNNSVI